MDNTETQVGEATNRKCSASSSANAFFNGTQGKLKKRPEFMSYLIESLKGFMQAIRLLSAFWWR